VSRVGVVTAVGSASKTFMGKTADGAEQSFVFFEYTAVHDAKDVARGPPTLFHGLAKGSKVVLREPSVSVSDTQ